jgi:hypothetical protein
MFRTFQTQERKRVPTATEAYALLRENPGTDDRRWLKHYVKIRNTVDALKPLAECESIEQSIETISKLRVDDAVIKSDELSSRLEKLRRDGLNVGGQHSGMEEIRAFTQEFLAFRREIWTGSQLLTKYFADHETTALCSEWEDQLLHLQDDLLRREWFAHVAESTLRPESLILDSDRDPTDVVLRRTAALLSELQRLTAEKPGDTDQTC